MKVYKQITDIFVKIVSAALMVLVAGIVGIMLYELCLRNFFNKSFRSSTELCGFLFMWMAFLGVVAVSYTHLRWPGGFRRPRPG